jgi:nicotinamidase-related amidase
LLLIDTWEKAANTGWLNRVKAHQKSKIQPLLELMRTHRVPIVHAPHGQPIAPILAPHPGEFVVDFVPSSFEASRDKLHQQLQSRGIRTLFYAGYASNWCLMHRPTGIIAMAFLGYEIVLIRDCTIAFETPETLAGEWCNFVTINTVEHQYGATVCLAELEAGFRSAPAHGSESADLAARWGSPDVVSNEQESEIERLSREKAELEAVLNAVRSSAGWRMLDRWRSLRDRLAPAASRRRKLYDFLMSAARRRR